MTNAQQIQENMQLIHALDASSEMILVIDYHGAIQYFNSVLCAFTGWQEELLGKSSEALDSPNANSQILAEMRLRLRQRRA